MNRHIGLLALAVAACGPSAATQVGLGQAALGPASPGVDRASALSVSEAQSYQSQYGIAWTGAYIGGACNAGSGWSSGTLTAIAQATGWQFMPIYVGQESPSICGAANLSSAQGTVDGNDAATILQQQYAWAPNSGIPVALDVESGTFDYSSGGTSAYVSAWASAVHNAGYLAYVYSSPSALLSFAQQGLPLDGVWIAAWPYTSFQGGLSPYSETDLGSYFTTGNRAWQYAGAGYIDFNTADIVLAPAPGQANSTADNCLGSEVQGCGNFGCGCADHVCSGDYCPGTGCSAQHAMNCGAFGCNCADGQCSGGFCPGSGCTVKETNDCGKFGCQCVDHQCSGGFCAGSGCTAKETSDCGNFGCQCVDHQCSGGFCPGTGCTAKESADCSTQGCNCVDHKCSGGTCGGSGCTALDVKNCGAFGCGCADHTCAGGACTPPDAGTPIPPDAGHTTPPDAGTAVDAGAQSTPDAGRGVNADSGSGSRVDSGGSAPEADAGEGARDASTPASGDDGGASTLGHTGCGCTSAGTSPFLGGLSIAMLKLRSPRRRRLSPKAT